MVLMGIAALCVLASLVMGIAVMAKGGETAKKYSNKLMRARVILQGIAVLFFIMAVISVKS